jgi:hypothetical protein
VTPTEIGNMQEKLAQAVGGPVIIRATLIPGNLVDFAGFDQRRQLENLFTGKMVDQGAEIVDMSVEEL